MYIVNPIDENRMLMTEIVEFKINGAVKYINVNDKYASKKLDLETIF